MGARRRHFGRTGSRCLPVSCAPDAPSRAGRRRGKRRVKQLISTVCEQPFPTNRRDARYARMHAARKPTASGGEPVNWSLLAQHQERDQHRDGREADRNDNDFEPRHAGSYAMPHGLRQRCQHSILALAAVRPKRCAGLPWRGPGAGLWAGPAASAATPFGPCSCRRTSET
jgi:hypothetical protein